MRLQGQTAVVIGASRGIGRAIAEALAREGARLVIASRSPQLKQAQRELSLISEVHAVRADAARPAAVRRIFSMARQEFGAPDIVVNSAGMAESQPVAQTSDELWNETLASNLTAAFLCSRAALELMLPRRHGHIVNIISTAAIMPFRGNSAYSAAKAGALAFTRVLREEVRDSGIRVTAVLPGPTDTAIWERLWPDAPREKMMSPADVAAAVLSALVLPENAVMEEILLLPIAGSL
jgi:NAD(P)-dependent dehydrogenase (short-subunit alcohol dehydrogenase family)